MGCVYARGRRLWIRYKDVNGKWTQSKTSFVGEEQRDHAKRMLHIVEARIAAGAQHGEGKHGPMTVARYAEIWSEKRRVIGFEDWKNDRARLNNHIVPKVGWMRLDEVRRSHVDDIFAALRAGKKHAPRTIRNIYSALCVMYNDAEHADLIPRDSSPCRLTERELGQLADKDLGWRHTAIFTRDELGMLISDERIPSDRRVLYALEGIGGLRHGEAAGLRWTRYDTDTRPLGCLVIATSYGKGRTKTKRTREVPVHPMLGDILAEWKQSGWAKMMGQEPNPEDLVVPAPAGPRTPLGAMRTKDYSYKRITKDLEALGLRHRRGHDLRRTMISLACEDGALPKLLERCTHTPKRDSAIELYMDFSWAALCSEISKLKISCPRAAKRCIATQRQTAPGQCSQPTNRLHVEGRLPEPGSKLPSPSWARAADVSSLTGSTDTPRHIVNAAMMCHSVPPL